MARDPFPTGDLRRNTSDPIYQPNHTGDVPAWAAAGIADSAQGFSRRLKDMAERAFKREGEADAADAIRAGAMIDVEPALRAGQGVDDQAYNTVVRQNLLTRRQAEYMAQQDKIEIDNPDSEVRFAEANAAIRAAFKPTGDPELDTQFANFATLQDAQALGRVRQRQDQTRQGIARGAYVETATVGRTAIGQAVASAGFDEGGAAIVGESLNQYAIRLARFGPREAFTIGGIEFAADPTRAGVATPELLAQTFNQVQAETRGSWIVNAAERVPDLGAKRAFAGQVRERWEAGDPVFAGLDATDMDRVLARVDGVVDRAEADQRAMISAAGERARDLLKAGEYGGPVDMEELRELAATSGDVGLMAQVDFAAQHGFEVTPESLRANVQGGAIGAGFAGWSNLLLDQLEGPGFVADDNGAGRSQWGITESSHPEAWRDGRIDRAEAAAIYKRDYWDAIGGDNLDPDLAIAAASAAVVGGVGTARELLRQSGGDVERFLQLEEARFRRLAASEPRHARHLEGWLNRIGRVRGAIQAQRAQRRAADGYVSDPIGYARGNGRRAPMATVAEFNPAGVFAGGAEAAQWTETLRQRRATGQGLSRRDGVPQRMLDDAEVSYYKDEINRDPSRIIPLVAASVAAVGPDGTRDLFAELGRGGVAGPDLHLASLAMNPRLGNVVRLALDGRVARSEGARLPDFGEAGTIQRLVQTTAVAWGTQPGLTPAVLSIAEDMAIADAQRGQLKDPAAYLNSALGSTNMGGHRYGGVARVNGAMTVAPTWLRADRFDEALEVMATAWTSRDAGPVYANGQPMPASVIRTYRPRLLANGRYGLVHPRTGDLVAGRNGRAFSFDIEGQRAIVRLRLSDAVMPGER